MAKKFNPAPGWPPAPEGWLPFAGWQPDPSWPPAPAGWQVVIDDGARESAQADNSVLATLRNAAQGLSTGAGAESDA